MATGNHSMSALAAWPVGADPRDKAEEVLQAKIHRAMLSGPEVITKDASVVEVLLDGTVVPLRQGTNGWTCFPGNENVIGDVPMCADAMGVEWMQCAMAKKPAPTNKAPGLIYMLCGATQHSTTDPFDDKSPAIPIGPHYMVIPPCDSVYDSKRDGIPPPNPIRDAGAWVMFDGTNYAHLHVCGDPWAGNVYQPDKNPDPIWSMRYTPSTT